MSNLRLVVDNTFQYASLRSYLINKTSANVNFLNEPLYVSHNIEVIYYLSDRWFIMTVVFGCLNLLAFGNIYLLITLTVSLILLSIFYRKRKHDY